MSRPQLIDDAQAAAGRGWRVFPLVPGRKQPRKAATDWETSATTSPERIARWWAAHPADNVAIATGPSALVVVDLDVPRPGDTPPPPQWAGCATGADVLDRLARSAGAHLPATFTVATPSGGRHLYFAAPGGPPLRNTSRRAGWKVDTRAAGGYVVAAGSELPAGRYELVDDRPPVALPGWLARLLAPPTPARPPAPRRLPSRRGYVAAALAGEVARVLDAGPGARNDALNRAAWNLGRHVAAGSLARQLVEDALADAATSAGYRDGAAAAVAVIRSALDARLNRPTTHRETVR